MRHVRGVDRGLHPEPPSPTILRRNLSRLAPGLGADQLDVREGRSDTVALDGTRLRFAHVDGGHNHEVALNDLRLVAAHIDPGGVVVVDDYGHPRWPGVATAVEAFLREMPEFSVLADVNRWTEPGRKLYLKRR